VLDEGLDVGWRDQTYLVAQLGNLTASEMSATAGFLRNDASWKLADKYQNLRPSQFLAQHSSACEVSSVNRNHILRQIESDCDNLRHDRSPMRIIADPPWHTDAVGRAVTSSKPVRKLGTRQLLSLPNLPDGQGQGSQ